MKDISLRETLREARSMGAIARRNGRSNFALDDEGFCDVLLTYFGKPGGFEAATSLFCEWGHGWNHGEGHN